MENVVYVITCTVNGKRYFGRTCRPAVRWRKHLADAAAGRGQYLHAAIRKHGAANFLFALVQEGLSTADAKEREAFWIAQERTCEAARGYNRTPGGEDAEGASMRAAEVRRRLRLLDPIGEAAKYSDRARKANAAQTPEQRRARQIKANAALTPEQRRDRIRPATASQTPEQRSARLRKWWIEKSQEERSEIIRQRNAALGPDGRRARTLKALGSQSPEQLAARGRKANAALTLAEHQDKGRRAWATRELRGNYCPEEHRAAVRNGWAKLSPEQRQARQIKVARAMSPEQHRSRAIKANASRTPEQKQAIAAKSWATRRARAEQADDNTSLHHRRERDHRT